MKVVVTGGTGFIGSHLVESLLREDHRVVCTVRRAGSSVSALPVGAESVDIVDLLDGSFDLSGTGALFHLAAIRHRWGASEADYLDSNVQLTRQLLDRSEGRVDHFLYCSSIAVFGWPPRGPIEESFPYDPINAYGRSKVLCEQMVFERHRQGRIPATVLRPSIAYGRRDPTGMLTKLATMLQRGIYATVGSGSNRVQLVHVTDLVQGFRKAAGNERVFGRGYILTARRPITINRLVELVAAELGRPVPRLRIPRPVARAAALALEAVYAVGLRPTGPEPIIAREKIQVMTTDRHYSIARAEEELEYAPSFDYEAGVADFVAGLKEEGRLPSTASAAPQSAAR